MNKSKVSRRLTESTAPEVCEHIYAPRLARDFPSGFDYLGDINQAHLLMLHRAGLLSDEDASGLAQALLQMEAEGASAVPLDPALEDAYFNFEAQLMRLAGAHLGGCLHVARSRNDILATLDRMRARQLAVSLIDGLCAARCTALEGAIRHAQVVMPGYTHLQPAQPITFGFYLLGLAEALGRDITRIRQLQAGLDLCPLGAGAIAGTSFPILQQESARLLGFSKAATHSLDAVASRDFALELMSAMAIAGIGSSRIAQDFYVWCTHEFSLVDFPDSVAGTSSMMPQKKNPVVLEYLKGKAGHLVGLLMAAMATMKGVNFTHTGDGSRETMRSLWEAGDESLHVLKMLDLILRTAIPNEEAMLRRAREDFCAATDLADALVRTSGLSFREAHHVVGAVVRSAMTRSLAAHQISSEMVDEAALAQIGRRLELGDQAVRDCLDPARSVSSRIFGGGPAPAIVLERAAFLLKECALELQANLERSNAFAQARLELKRSLRALIIPAPA